MSAVLKLLERAVMRTWHVGLQHYFISQQNETSPANQAAQLDSHSSDPHSGLLRLITQRESIMEKVGFFPLFSMHLLQRTQFGQMPLPPPKTVGFLAPSIYISYYKRIWFLKEISILLAKDLARNRSQWFYKLWSAKFIQPFICESLKLKEMSCYSS